MSEREEDAAGATMTLYAWFSFEKGLSDILAGPISSVWLGDEVGLGLYGLGKWKVMVVFSRVVLLLSSTSEAEGYGSAAATVHQRTQADTRISFGKNP